MPLLQQFTSFVSSENLFQPKDRLLLAVSGGVDSVVLCEVCKQAGYDFEIAHCNFQLRGAESDADELFVASLAKKYEVPFHVQKFDTEKFATDNKTSIQVAARELRYAWFKELMLLSQANIHSNDPQNGNALRYLLTAQHANDNMETLLMNFFKGTGIKGLQGIQPKSGENNYLLRPLLFAKKEELLRFAKEYNLLFREDSSNKLDKYTRNYFRNRLIPALQEIYPQVEDNLLDNLDRFKEINLLYRQSVEYYRKKLLVVKGDEVHISQLKLLKTPGLHTVLYEIMQEFGFAVSQVQALVKLLNSESGKYINSNTHRVLLNRNWLIISKLKSTASGHFLIEANDRHLSFPCQQLGIEKISKPSTIDASASIALLDMSDIKFPLLLRKWQKGDYFYPLGMKKKKKLSRFFIDQKLSLLQKENVWVLEMNKKIIWVVGHRIDDRFRITEQTTEVLKLQVLPA